ncbi:MAG: DegV family protein [Clostridia bacterium]|nr:DegV family protein [Clostridia bacterium]
MLNKKIRVVTDSTSDLPPEYVKENNINVIPLYVNFPDATYRDGVDMAPAEFYPLLKSAKDFIPKTSTPTREDFTQVYKSLLEEGYEVISIHISSGLSSTFSIAKAAAQTLSDRIHVFDSKSISLGIGLQVMETVDMIKQDLHLSEIADYLHKLRHRTEVLFSIDTLEYLQKGGRIGKVSSLLGSILNIKPVIRVEDGIYVPLDKVRNQKQAIKRKVEHMAKVLDGLRPRYVGVAHGAAEEAAHCLKELAESTFDIKVSILQEASPVIGVHAGPGCLGLSFTY